MGNSCIWEAVCWVDQMSPEKCDFFQAAEIEDDDGAYHLDYSCCRFADDFSVDGEVFYCTSKKARRQARKEMEDARD